MSLIEVLQIGVYVAGICSPIIGWVMVARKADRGNATREANTNNALTNNANALKELRESHEKSNKEIKDNQTNAYKRFETQLQDIKQTIGNGGFTGLKGEIQNLQINCAREMAELKTSVRVHHSLTVAQAHPKEKQ